MKRRVFTTTLLAAPALIGQARATEDKSRWIEASRFQFLDDGDLQRPNWLVLGTGETPVGWDLRPAVTEFPAETLNIGARLGGLFRKPIGERLRGGWLLGPVHMYGRNLVVPYDAEASRAAIAHQRTEWAYRSRAKTPAVQPAAGQLNVCRTRGGQRPYLG